MCKAAAVGAVIVELTIRYRSKNSSSSTEELYYY